MILPGNAVSLGAVVHSDGVNFAVASSTATFIELCLFDAAGNQTMSYRLPGKTGDIHHGFLPGCRTGQQYGFRAHGAWNPDRGLRHNPAKLLLDPYARQLAGQFAWHHAVFDNEGDEAPDELNIADSAPYVPRSVVVDILSPAERGPAIPWADSVFYETNVRGYTMLHPAIDEAHRGTFAGMRHSAVLEHLKALGVTSIELMPVQAYIDELHLHRLGLRNFWGYNTVAFMAPMPRLAGDAPIAEFRDMVRAIHDAGMEVILDVAFNHTGEGGHRGPTLSFRGLDNLGYYRTLPDDPTHYINDTGTGNTIDADNAIVQRLIVDSLKYWVTTMGVDGFRFDLAPILGRHATGFSATHPLLEAISTDPLLSQVKLIAEPWDAGPGGYQLGHFPPSWAEWNDRFRDGVRRFWRGDPGMAGEFARRLHGSADVFDCNGRTTTSSINFITAHDGFTLNDLVSYEQRHNEANGEENRDGHTHNFSMNYGTEGPSDDPDVIARRRRHRLNLLATVLFSQGAPMLLAGDEFGNSQGGNNNAYAQDNETGWLDWSKFGDDPAFLEAVKAMIRLRRKHSLLRVDRYIHEGVDTSDGRVTIDWLNPDGEVMQSHEWTEGRSKLVLLELAGQTRTQLAVVVNGADEDIEFDLPDAGDWTLEFSTATSSRLAKAPAFSAAGQSVSLLASTGSGSAGDREGTTQ